MSDGHVELALALYNDLELLREVLARAGLPEGAERVAISLDDPIEGPFVVVTREGRFVTCLGAGMLVSDLPIVTRERLDAAAARVVAQVCAQSTEVSQEEIDAVPEDVARIAYVSSQVTIHRSEELAPLLASMHALPWLVRASPAELFLPAEWARKLVHPRGLADVLFWFRPYVENCCMISRQPPRRVEAAPGRNDPCPCGSGKKHKRCCGR